MGSDPILLQRVDNWARWCRVGQSAGHCMSFEGNYRSPQRNHWELPVSATRGQIDPKDAWRVEVAWGSLPYFDRVIIRANYCYGWPAQRTCRTAAKEAGIRVHPGKLGERLDQSLLMLGWALENTEQDNRNILRAMTQKILALVRPRVLNTD